MQINDRLLTVITGVVLAISGATASLYLGEEDHINDPNATVVASTVLPALPDVMAAIEPAQREVREMTAIMSGTELLSATFRF